jgi:hypothetical protein
VYIKADFFNTALHSIHEARDAESAIAVAQG